MENKATGQTTQREAVKEYLQQYHIARRKKRILEERRWALSSELTVPAGSSFGPGAASKRSRGGNNDGTATVVLRIAEIDERIEHQQAETAKAVLRIMDLIDLLPAESMERTVVEMRHIDCKGWDRIARDAHISRAAAFKYYNAALDTLLEFPSTRKLLEKFRKCRRF